MIIRTLTLVAVLASSSFAADRRVPTTDRGVDVVTLTDGERILGAIAARDEAGNVTIAVRRVWLEEHHRERADDLLAAAERERKAAHERRLERIAEWRESRADRPGLARFLDTEVARLRKEFEEADDDPEAKPSEFVLVPLAADEIRRVYVQPVPRRRVALLAWRERLEDVEERSADALARDLKRQNVAMPEGVIDLSDRFPPNAATGDDEATWAARVALVEYQYVQPLDFQGTGNVLIRTTGRDEEPGLEEVLAAFVKPAATVNLLDLLDPPKGAPRQPAATKPALDTAIKEAEARGLTGFRVTRVEPDLVGNRARVETSFVAKLPTGWTTVWRKEVTADATRVRPELEERIAEDERVGKLLTTIRTLGVGGDEAVTKAIRFGAATMAAQEAANDAFFEFTESAGESLDARWPATP